MRNYIKYFIALLLFGSNGIIASHISNTGYEIALMRTGIGALFLILIFLLTEDRVTFLKNKKDLLFIAVSGSAMGLSWICLFEGYAQIGVSVTSLLYYCGPVIVMVLSPLIFGERLTLVKIMGFAAVVIGVILVNGGFLGEDLNVFGLVYGAASAAAYAVMVIFNKKCEKISGLKNSVFQMISGFLTVFVFTCFKGGLKIHINSGEIIWILILGVINTGIGCYFYFSSIEKLPVSTVAVCGYIEPLSAVILSVLILKESMLPIQAAGAVLILGGAMASEGISNIRNAREKG